MKNRYWKYCLLAGKEVKPGGYAYDVFEQTDNRDAGQRVLR